jgi:hypothetical protein
MTQQQATTTNNKKEQETSSKAFQAYMQCKSVHCTPTTKTLLYEPCFQPIMASGMTGGIKEWLRTL